MEEFILQEQQSNLQLRNQLNQIQEIQQHLNEKQQQIYNLHNTNQLLEERSKIKDQEIQRYMQQVNKLSQENRKYKQEILQLSQAEKKKQVTIKQDRELLQKVEYELSNQLNQEKLLNKKSTNQVKELEAQIKEVKKQLKLKQDENNKFEEKFKLEKKKLLKEEKSIKLLEREKEQMAEFLVEERSRRMDIENEKDLMRNEIMKATDQFQKYQEMEVKRKEEDKKCFDEKNETINRLENEMMELKEEKKELVDQMRQLEILFGKKMEEDRKDLLILNVLPRVICDVKLFLQEKQKLEIKLKEKEHQISLYKQSEMHMEKEMEELHQQMTLTQEAKCITTQEKLNLLKSYHQSCEENEKIGEEIKRLETFFIHHREKLMQFIHENDISSCIDNSNSFPQEKISSIDYCTNMIFDYIKDLCVITKETSERFHQEMNKTDQLIIESQKDQKERELIIEEIQILHKKKIDRLEEMIQHQNEQYHEKEKEYEKLSKKFNVKQERCKEIEKTTQKINQICHWILLPYINNLRHQHQQLLYQKHFLMAQTKDLDKLQSLQILFNCSPKNSNRKQNRKFRSIVYTMIAFFRFIKFKLYTRNNNKEILTIIESSFIQEEEKEYNIINNHSLWKKIKVPLDVALDDYFYPLTSFTSSFSMDKIIKGILTLANQLEKSQEERKELQEDLYTTISQQDQQYIELMELKEKKEELIKEKVNLEIENKTKEETIHLLTERLHLSDKKINQMEKKFQSQEDLIYTIRHEKEENDDQVQKMKKTLKKQLFQNQKQNHHKKSIVYSTEMDSKNLVEQDVEIIDKVKEYMEQVDKKLLKITCCDN